MKDLVLFGTVLVSALAASVPAAAKEKSADSDSNEQAEKSDPEDYGHGGQFSLRAALVPGYRVVFRYDASHYCMDPADDEGDPQQLCGFGAPLGLDLALGFAPLDAVEPYAWARFGLGAEDQTDTEALRAFGAGVRIYSRSSESLKIFVEPALAFEFEGSQGSPAYQTNDPNYNTDLILHVAAGPQYDLTENVGLYLGAGLTAGIFRAIHTNMEIQIGMQGRI